MKLAVIAWLVAHGWPGWLAPDYATMIGLAGIVGSVLVLRLARRDGASPELHARTLLIAFLSALAGGYVFESVRAIPEALAAHSLVPIVTAGRAAYGGLLAGILVPAWYLRRRGASVSAFFDRATLAMGTLFALVRFGCFLEGCDFGRPTSSLLGVRFPAGSPAAEAHATLGWVQWGQASLPVHATELYEAALGVFASLAALVWLRRGRRDGAAFVTWIATYAAGRVALELFRGDVDRGVYAGLSTAQLVSIALLGACAFTVLRRREVVRAVAALGVSVMIIGGCVAEPSPPIAELALRDALSADPSVIAGLPADERLALAHRFEEARATRDEAESAELTAAAEGTPEEQLTAIDDARKRRRRDAIVGGALERSGARVSATAPSLEIDDAHPPATPIVLEGPEPTTTRDAELRALGGKAGLLVRALSRASNAPRFVRVVGWPGAIVASGDAVYVNAAWLVAMASLDPTLPTELRPAFQGPSSDTTHPLVVLRGASVFQCVNNLTEECNQCLALPDGGVCSGSVALTDMPSVRDECAFLAQDRLRYTELCGLYFISSKPSLATCLAARNDCALQQVPLTSGNLATAQTFAATASCVTKLDECMQGGGGGGGGGAASSPSPTTSSSSSGCNKCCADKGCGPMGCKEGTGSCGKLCTDGRCKNCSVQSDGQSAPKSPWALSWIVALVYLARRGRRPRAPS